MSEQTSPADDTVVSATTTEQGFASLELIPAVLTALSTLGYETPTPIQEQMIPHVLAGKDVIGQAQTGTGKTAAFALPLLSRIDLKVSKIQVLVLAPTRELAIQVAEAFHSYAGQMRGFHVLPVYGGQNYSLQLRQLARGVHVVVGTPGRVIDHIKRGTLKLDGLQTLVLDEADEMLRMGFIDDVEWILEQTPDSRQIALFSATMPREIRNIARKHLNKPEEVAIRVRTSTAETIRQRFWMVSGFHKLDALTRILEAETIDGVIIFVRTKVSTMELAEKLEARGYSCAALNGDLVQSQREQTIEQLKSGKLDILVATDVAARGLDVERISHVINYDIPYDPEAYVHRIGRTGRAGRTGEAILFVSPREKRMLHSIERATRQKISMMSMPSTEAINNKRIAKFKQTITDILANDDTAFYMELLEQYRQEHDVPALEIAAALAKISQGENELLLTELERRPRRDRDDRGNRGDRGDRGNRHDRHDRKFNKGNRRGNSEPEEGMERFRLEVGHSNDVRPENIVGAIANEANISSRSIGRISIFDDYSTVDLPSDMPTKVFQSLKNVRISGRPIRISKSRGRGNQVDYRKKKPRNNR
ncbi:MAG: DEAD/DEAH box helicase [Mariprofundales bacterium]